MNGERVVGVFGLIEERPGDSSTAPPPHLTPRQVEVLRLLEQGRSTKQIAAELHLTTETVRTHIRRLFRALGVNSRLEAVAAARSDRARPRRSGVLLAGTFADVPRVSTVDAMLLGAVLLWALNVTVTKYMFEHGWQPLAYGTIRYFAAISIFWIYTWRRERSFRIARDDWVYVGIAAAMIF